MTPSGESNREPDTGWGWTYVRVCVCVRVSVILKGDSVHDQVEQQSLKTDGFQAKLFHWAVISEDETEITAIKDSESHYRHQVNSHYRHQVNIFP